MLTFLLYLFVMCRNFKSDTIDVHVKFSANAPMMCHVCHQNAAMRRPLLNLRGSWLFNFYILHFLRNRRWFCSFTAFSPSRTQMWCLWMWFSACLYNDVLFLLSGLSLLSKISEAKCKRLVGGCRRLIAQRTSIAIQQLRWSWTFLTFCGKHFLNCSLIQSQSVSELLSNQCL